MPLHINFLEFMLKWQRLLSGLLHPLFVWNLVGRNWYYDHLHDDRVLTHTCLSFFRLPLQLSKARLAGLLVPTSVRAN